MLNHPRRHSALFAVVVALALIVAACSGGGGDDEADEADAPQGDAMSFTIWAPQSLEPTVGAIVDRFEKRQPEIDVEVVYAPASELSDRFLVGERPDLYISTERDVDQQGDKGTPPVEAVDFGSDTLELVVAPGNPKQIVDLSVFGVDPTTTSGLCEAEASCGRAARTMLEKAGVVPQPDVTDPSWPNLIEQVGNGAIDATLVYRTKAVKARRDGTVEYVVLPSTQQLEVRYQAAVFVKGAALDKFLADLETSSTSIDRIFGLTGLAPLEGNP